MPKQSTIRKRKSRASETDEQREIRHENDRASKRVKRATESPEQQKQIQQKALSLDYY